ncbi:MAG: CBASS cGAMP synthase [Gammaproteobacteria bacterium]|nr:CBASS cGAMP synthase [Gammaproteobacteria bacterium]
MNKRRDLNKAFQKFFKNLQISEQDRKRFLEVRRIVRQNLRKKFAEIKFLTQGSFAYHTLINPTQCPPQQMDLDDGAYFPIGNGLGNPRALFGAVDQILEEVANESSWSIDTSKTSCSRLIIAGNMHVDIPLYRVAGNDVRNNQNTGLVDLYRSAGIPYYPSSEQVLLAQRTGDWIVSDPRIIIEWALSCVSKYGQQYLRLCCYFKGWRDQKWTKSPMKSILIMAMIDYALKNILNSGDKADDAYVVYECAKSMIEQLQSGGIKDPSDNDKFLDDDIDYSQKADIVEKLHRLADLLEKSLYEDSLNPDDLCQLLHTEFGKFFPRDPSLFEIHRPSYASVAPAIATPISVPTNSPWAE